MFVLIYRYIIFLMIGLLSLCLSFADAKTLFEDKFNSGMSNWQVVGPPSGEVDIRNDNSAPAKYGPKVLFMKEPASGSDLMAFVKDLIVTDGFYEILWKDAGLPEDTDGPIWFRGQNMQNGPQGGNGYLVELDTDTGLHIGVIKNGTEGPTFISPGVEKSSGDWTWMKVQFEGPDIKVKIWSANEGEPAKWNLEAKDSSFQEGTVGLRCWSGTAHIAYVRISDLKGPTPVEHSGKLANTWGSIKAQN
ncbi:MAG: hypothetical protein ACPL7B_14520 [Candidatus Poribacteria bacterium]